MHGLKVSGSMVLDDLYLIAIIKLDTKLYTALICIAMPCAAFTTGPQNKLSSTFTPGL